MKRVIHFLRIALLAALLASLALPVGAILLHPETGHVCITETFYAPTPTGHRLSIANLYYP